jgi:integrase
MLRIEHTMPRHATPLSTRKVQSLKRPGFFCDGGGLYLQVARGGTKSWVFRYKWSGNVRAMGLGSLTTFGLAEARERARRARQLVADGIDPIEARNRTRGASVKALTFRQCAERYVAAHETGWKSSGRHWLASLENHVFPVFGDVSVAAVDLPLVMQAIEPIWTAKPVTANLARNRVEMVLDWARVRGLREGENPARWKGHLETLLPSVRKMPVAHRAALSYREIGEFMVRLRALDGVAARALELTILTACRTSEVTGARWDEIDMAERVWTIPGERMKSKQQHRVPLSDAAMAVLAQQDAVREGDLVFPAPRNPAKALAKGALRDALLKLDREITTHGFRSSFRDWAAELTNFPREVCEASLAHTIGDATSRAYQRSDFLAKRRQIMDAWSRYIATPAAKTGEVIVLARG